jgi:hypothetical protein
VDSAQFHGEPASAINTFGIHNSGLYPDSFKLGDLQRKVEEAKFLDQPASSIRSH